MDRAEPLEEIPASAPTVARWAQTYCLWFLIVILAWAPFPLGSNREWSWSLLTLLIAACWLLWTAWCWTTLEAQWNNLKRLCIPLALAATTLGWATIQALPVVPAGLVHPVWLIAGNLLHHAVSGSISLNPWVTLSEVTKLSTYIAVAWIAFTLSLNAGCAGRLLNAIISIGAFYALYAFALGLIGTQQFGLFYSVPIFNTDLSGPFVNRNSFATFEGLATLASLARLVELGYSKIVAKRGIRRCVITTIQFIFGSGIPIFIATLLTISAVVASASRGGSFATLCALIAMVIPFASMLKRDGGRRWVLIGAGAVLSLLIVLVWISGDTLTDRIEELIDADNADVIRVALWAAASRMIKDAPFLGLGLGTFQDAYPLYASKIFPLIMDKAHSDYLEFAAGLGLPAAFCWWSAIIWSAIKMGRGIYVRRKDRIYPLIGLGATILVAIHSSVDFSLQIPAVAITYAAILGLGLAQSYATHRATQ